MGSDEMRALDRLLSKCTEGSGGCWQWTAGTANGGYGKFRHQGKTCVAHRVSWLLLRGAVPSELQLDHLCRNRLCVNPWHLEPVTPRVNTSRGRRANAEKSHCPAGHAYDFSTTYVDRRGHRHCKPCRAAAARRRRERARG